jgi:hypothetical protein
MMRLLPFLCLAAVVDQAAASAAPSTDMAGTFDLSVCLHFRIFHGLDPVGRPHPLTCLFLFLLKRIASVAAQRRPPSA